MKYVNVMFEGIFDKKMLEKYKIDGDLSGFFASRNFLNFSNGDFELNSRQKIIDELNGRIKNLGLCLIDFNICEFDHKDDDNFQEISGFTFYV